MIKAILNLGRNMIIDNKNLRNKFFVFLDREHAGKKLAEFLKNHLKEKENLTVLAIPRGGVPIGCIVARELNAEFGLIIVRKVPIPWDTEAGFGAVSPNGDVIIDEEFRTYLDIDDETVRKQVEIVLKEIRRRENVFKQFLGENKITGRNIILIDDGIAAGFTMLAAIKYVKKRNPRKIYIAVPTANLNALKMLEPFVDAIFCLNVRVPIPYFAVADAYEKWYDLTDEDVFSALKKYGYIS